MVKVLGHGDNALINWMATCRRAGGVPIVKTKYGGVPLDQLFGRKYGLRPHVVLTACWGAGSKVKGGVFDSISDELYRKIVTIKGEWKQLLQTQTARV
jgi:hypothetical protein